MQEAIAHQVVEVVNRVHKKEHSNKGISAAVVCAVACAMDINKIHNSEGIDIPINEQFLPMVQEILGDNNSLTSGGGRGNGDEDEDEHLPEEVRWAGRGNDRRMGGAKDGKGQSTHTNPAVH
jgi:hypothetical protein